MKAILNFALKMLPYMLTAVSVFVGVRVLVHIKTGRRVNLYREWAMLFLAVFCAGLASQTVISQTDALTTLREGVHKTNLVPFRVVVDTCRELFVKGNTQSFFINFLGNIALFVPLGVFFPLLWRLSVGKTAMIGFCISLFIELSQLFLPRATDVDDLILNTAGALLGAWLYRLFSKKHPSLAERFKR